MPTQKLSALTGADHLLFADPCDGMLASLDGCLLYGRRDHTVGRLQRRQRCIRCWPITRSAKPAAAGALSLAGQR